MKRIIFLLLLTPTTLLAQKFGISMGAGPCFFSNETSTNSTYPAVFRTTFYYYLNFCYRINDNFDINIRGNGYSVKSYYSYLNYNSVAYADQMISWFLLFNKHTSFSFGEIYGGVSLGWASYNNIDSTFWYRVYPNTELATASGSGLVMGAQMGCNFKMSKRLDFNIEFAMQYLTLKSNSPHPNVTSFKYSYVDYTPTIGLKYKFPIGGKHTNDKSLKSPTKKNKKAKPKRTPFIYDN